ncbi:MAG: hypothetical protein ACRCV7_06820 [Culicoidibacterales bacterium]
MLHLFEIMAEEAHGPHIEVGGLFPESFNFIIALGTLAIVMFIMYKFLWKHLVTFIETRQNHIEHEIKAATEKNVNAEKMLSESKEKLENVHAESEHMMKAAQERVKTFEESERVKFLEQMANEKVLMQERLDTELKKQKQKQNEEVLTIASELAARFLKEQPIDTVEASIQKLQKVGE